MNYFDSDMMVTYFFLLLLVIILSKEIIRTKKIKSAPYFKMKRKYEKESFSSDQQIQTKASLKLLWLQSLEQFYSNNTDTKQINLLLKDISNQELNIEWSELDTTNISHFHFGLNVLRELDQKINEAKTLVNIYSLFPKVEIENILSFIKKFIPYYNGGNNNEIFESLNEELKLSIKNTVETVELQISINRNIHPLTKKKLARTT